MLHDLPPCCTVRWYLGIGRKRHIVMDTKGLLSGLGYNAMLQ